MAKVSELLGPYTDHLKLVFEHPELAFGLPLGYDDIDRVLYGAQPTDLIVVASRPGVGKTSFLLNAQINALFAGKKVLFFSLEMSAEQVLRRAVAILSGVSSSKLRSGFSSPEWNAIQIALDVLDGFPWWIDDTARARVRWLAQQSQLIHDSEKIDGVFVDYLQLVDLDSADRTGSRVLDIGVVTAQLKALAKQLNVPVIAAAQLSRSVEQRRDGRPTLADLRESGAIENDADVVMLMWRDRDGDEQVVHVDIAKHRNGPTAQVELLFDKATTMIQSPPVMQWRDE